MRPDGETAETRTVRDDGEGSPEEQRGGSGETSPSSPMTPTDASAVEQDFEALLADAHKERDEYLELAKRAQADFENYRKRMSSEVQDTLITVLSEKTLISVS